MRLTRIYSETPLAEHSSVRLAGASARHLATALRLQPGAAVVLFDGSGLEYAGRIARVQRGAVEIELGPAERIDREAALDIELLQGVCRRERMDLVVQKATELGAASIRPVITSYATVRLDAARIGKRLEHWRRIAIAACEQCGRNRLPRILPPVPFADALEAVDTELALVLDPAARGGFSPLARPAHNVALLVGPEGGLDTDELALARRTGFHPVRLGPRVLRTETAAIAALAALQTLWGDFS